MSGLEPGRIVAHDLGRHFQLTGGGRSLRATLLRYPQAEKREFWAVRHVELDIRPGETFGIIGRNGSGKSTLLKMLAKIFGPSEGSCDYGGRLSSLLELGAGFHPEFSAIENIYLSAAIYGIPRREIERDIDAIIGFAELEAFAHQPVKTFSSGMFARLGFSVAMHVRPDVLLLDEVFAVGDEPFVRKCLGRIGEYKRGGGTIILVTHDAGTVERICDRATILDHGEQVYLGTGGDAVVEYHQRLVGEQPHVESRAETRSRDSTVDVAVRTLDRSGAPVARYMEGDPILIGATVTSTFPIRGARITIGLRDASGFGLANRSLPGLDLKGGVPRDVHLELSAPPLREGLFSIDVHVRSDDRSETFAILLNLAQFSVSSRTPNAEGPILLQGIWSTAP